MVPEPILGLMKQTHLHDNAEGRSNSSRSRISVLKPIVKVFVKEISFGLDN